MKWTMDHRGELTQSAVTEAERLQAERGIGEMCSATHGQAVTTGGRLRQALLDQRLPWDTLKSLSRWCYTEGSRQSGIAGARQVSRAFFKGYIVPRLATDESRQPIDTHVAREAMRRFLEELEDVPSGSPAEAPEGPEDPPTIVDPGVSAVLPARAEESFSVRWGRGRGSAGPATHGSRFCLQQWVGEAPGEFGARIVANSLSLALSEVRSLEWKSPLAAENYYEYRDDFLGPLALEQHAGAVRRFWPAAGPQWDALALLRLAEGRGVLLVEAKAHPAESRSHCAATDPASLAQIDAALGKVQRFMGATGHDWKSGAYQLANRLAFLYLLNEELHIPTWLALVHFVDDRSHRATGISDWARAAGEPFRRLGLRPDSPLLERVIPTFVPSCPVQR